MERISGNTHGLKSGQEKALARIYRRKIPPTQLFTPEIGDTMGRLAVEIGRELAILVNRRGHIVDLVVGEATSLVLPAIRKREAQSRLSGLRCIHFRQAGGGITRGDLVNLAIQRLDLLTIVSWEKGSAGVHNAEIWLAHLDPLPDNEGNVWRVSEAMRARKALGIDFEDWIADREREFAAHSGPLWVETGKERALLVGLGSEGIDELAALVDAAGAEVLGQMIQRRNKPDSATFLGKGKVEEVSLQIRELGATVVVVDAELSPSQQANLERNLGVKVIDRPGLILDIFAQRAHTREGKLQVELALLNYLLPRLSGRGEIFSRLGGGIGTRGPGESKLEVDRRHIQSRIHHITGELEAVRKQRGMQRRSRTRRGVVVCALVGYTNSGKSTLLNALTRSDVLTQDKLFATLDPTTRKLRLPSGQHALLTDTVGFLQRLPHQLVAAFRATLEEVTEADILIHVVDATHPQVKEQIEAVELVLGELGAEGKPQVTVLNKCDTADTERIADLLAVVPLGLEVSARKGTGFVVLLAEIDRLVSEHAPPVAAMSP